MPGKTYMKGWKFRRFSVGTMFRESSDGKWERQGKPLRFWPIFTRRPDGWMLSFVAFRYCVGIAVLFSGPTTE